MPFNRQALCLLFAVTTAGCQRPALRSPAGNTTLRIAINSGRMSLSAPEAGFNQVKQNLSVESLGGFADDGTPRPVVAEGWNVSPDRKVVTIRLRPNVKYQDGTPVTAADIATILKTRLPREMGPAFSDIEEIREAGPHSVEIRFGTPSGFRLELLEIAVLKPGQPDVGTGAFMPVPNTRDQLQANENYYLGKPAVDRISIQNYPSFRAAWADMLRDRNDMLYEVGVDALDSLRGATNVHVFAYPRRYQYLVLLNRNVPALQDPKIRTALNFAIDRERLIREALNGHGTASIGPVSPKQWAVANREIPRFGFDPQRAVTLVHQTNQHVSFKCLVLPDYERLALVVKSQLAEIGVDMAVEETTTDNMVQRLNARDFDAILLDAISGPTMYRLYRFWHSGSMLDASGIGGPAVEAALDQIRHSASDDEYRAGVLGFLRAVTNDPPAIFLAWSEGARAVSSRFQVAIDADRRDPIATVRLWRPTNPLDARRN